VEEEVVRVVCFLVDEVPQSDKGSGKP
jgi:hypothetical protein